MKTTSIFIAVLLLGIAAAQARIGNTEAECDARYAGGTSSRSKGMAPAEFGKAYTVGGWLMTANFWKGRVACFTYSKPSGDITASDQQRILGSYSGGQSWSGGAEIVPGANGMLQSPDGQLVAYADEISVVIYTKAFYLETKARR